MKSSALAVRILPLNFNGRDLLKKFLPSVIASAKASRHRCAVSILDNCSTDGSIDFLKNNFPDVSIISAPANKALCSYNFAAEKLSEDILIFLNTDMKTELQFVDPLIEPFLKYDDIFFVATHDDRARIGYRWGIMGPNVTYSGYKEAIEKPGYTLSAGVGAFHRKRFLEIGGYDEIYLPAYYEDVDLGYRGWKKGWKGYYQPESRKFHVGSGSFSKYYSQQSIQRISFRNSILFMLKNISDVWILTRFILMLPLRLLAALLMGKWYLIQGFWDAIRMFPKALSRRQEVKKQFLFSDKEVEKLINGVPS